MERSKNSHLWFGTIYSYTESLRARGIREKNQRLKYFSGKVDLDEVLDGTGEAEEV